MDEENNDGDLGAPVMERSEKPPHIQLCNNLDDTLVSLFKIRNIVERENHARYELDDEKKKGYSASVIPYLVFMGRDKLLFCEDFYLFKVISI